MQKPDPYQWKASTEKYINNHKVNYKKHAENRFNVNEEHSYWMLDEGQQIEIKTTMKKSDPYNTEKHSY